MNDELINLLREIRPSFSDVGSRDVDTRRKQNQIDRAIELLSASKPAAPNRDAALAKWTGEVEGAGIAVTSLMRSAYRDGWDDALAVSPTVAQDVRAAYCKQCNLDADPICSCDAGKAALAASPAAPQPSPTAVVLDDERAAQPETVLDWLETEVTEISCRHHGDPSYDHDAYWMKDRVVKLIGDARKAFPVAQPVEQTRALTKEIIGAAWRDCGARSNSPPDWALQFAQNIVKALTTTRPATGETE